MKWRIIGSIGLTFGLCLALSACGGEQESSSSGEVSYKEMKTMVVDILKSDEGKKAVKESISDAEGTSGMSMKMMPLQTSEEIKTAVKDTLTAPAYQKQIEKIMKDPKFASDFAKAIQSQSKELHLQLIKDPSYQKSVEEIMKSPEMMTMFLNLTKTADYRKQSMKIMQESMQNPLFRMEVLDLLKKVVQEELEPKDQKEAAKGNSSGGNGKGGGEEKQEVGGQESGS